ncbi:MAG: FISUMP domain-containing protein, partial [Mucinivorans sp.]
LIIEGPAHYAMEVEFTFKNGSKVNQYYPRILINNGGEVMRNKIYRLTITASGNPDFSTKSEVLQWQTVGSDIDLRMTAMDSFDAVGKSYHVKVNGGVSPYKYQWYVNDELRSESSTGRSTDYRIEPLRYTDILDCNLKCVVTDANGTTCTATHAAGLLRMTMMDSVSSATDLRYMQNWDSKFDDIEIQNGGPNASRVRYLRDKRDNRVYRVKKMASNAWWMVQNLAYQPSKSDINTSKPGFYGGTVFPWPDRVSMGYYSYPVVFQVPYQTLAADIPEKVQGICPQGWRVPNNEDFKAVYPLFTSSESNYPQLSGTNDAGAQDFELEAERYALSQNGTMERLAWMKSKYYLWSSSNWPGQSNRKTTVYGNTIDGIMFLRNNEPDWGSVNGYLMAVRCVRDIVIYM